MLPPHFRLPPPTAQTGRGRELKFFMEVRLWTTTGVIQAIFGFPPLSRAMGGWGSDPGGEKMVKSFFFKFPIFSIEYIS